MKRFLLAFLLCTLIPLAACDTQDEPVDRTTAANISTAIMMSVNQAVEDAEASASSRCAEQQDLDIYYISGGVSVTGTRNWDEAASTFTYDLDVTFTDFAFGTNEGIIIINGSTSLSGTFVLTENFSKQFDYTGDFIVGCDDATYDISWNVHFLWDATGMNYSGTYEINGVEYDFEYAMTI